MTGQTRKVYVGLGANLGDPERQLKAALEQIGALAGLDLLACSSLYRSAPMGLPGQPDYCNAVCVLQTALPAADLMVQLLRIERGLGRFRDGRRWGARMIDLDMLHVEGEASSAPELQLPHPGIAARNFVLVPLSEVAPDLVIPQLGSVAQRAVELGTQGLSIWSPCCETARLPPLLAVK